MDLGFIAAEEGGGSCPDHSNKENGMEKCVVFKATEVVEKGF